MCKVRALGSSVSPTLSQKPGLAASHFERGSKLDGFMANAMNEQHLRGTGVGKDSEAVPVLNRKQCWNHFRVSAMDLVRESWNMLSHIYYHF
jgi:hypothetical protein